MTDRITLAAGNRRAMLYRSAVSNAPLIVVNGYEGDSSDLLTALESIEAPAHNLLMVGDLDWNHDMTPWPCPPLFANDTPCTGGADEYLRELTEQIIPAAKNEIEGEAPFTAIAGYSLAGLFAVYAMYRCDAFDRAASMSGSLWYPDFKEYAMSHEPVRKPSYMYLSLGLKEAKTRHPLMRNVRDNTDSLAEYYRSLGIDLTYELNPGNHFTDADLRSAKGIKAVSRVNR